MNGKQVVVTGKQITLPSAQSVGNTEIIEGTGDPTHRTISASADKRPGGYRPATLGFDPMQVRRHLQRAQASVILSSDVRQYLPRPGSLLARGILRYDQRGRQRCSWAGITLPQPRSYYLYDKNGDGNVEVTLRRLATDCTVVADAYVNFPDYVGINLMFNELLDCCAWGGGWYLNLDGVHKLYRMTWEPPWAFCDISVIEHEMGHGFGMPHSSGMYGQTYDNVWDVMSATGAFCTTANPVFGCPRTAYHLLSQRSGRLDFLLDKNTWRQAFSQTITLERLALPRDQQLPHGPDSDHGFYNALLYRGGPPSCGLRQ